MTKDIIKLL